MNPAVARWLFLLVAFAGYIWSYVGVPYYGLKDEHTTSWQLWNFLDGRPFASGVLFCVTMFVVKDGWSEEVGWWWMVVLLIGLGGLAHATYPLFVIVKQ